VSPLATAVGTETLDVPDEAELQLIVDVFTVAAFALLKKSLLLKEVKIGVETINVVERRRLRILVLFTLLN